MEKDRIVVTGMGIMTPIANTPEEFSSAIFSGKSSIKPIKAFDTSKHEIKHGGEVKGFKPDNYFRKLNSADFGRCTQLAVATSKLAYQMAGLNRDIYEPRRIGCIFGTTMGNHQIMEDCIEMVINENKDHARNNIRNMPTNVITSAIAAELDLKGPNLVIPTACAAGNYAIGYASDLIKSGKTDCVICGGSDAISRVCFTMFLRLGAMSPDICRPFDENRRGMIVSEGAAALVLEKYENAKKRNAAIYAEIAGYGNSCDAYHVTAPHPEGRGAILAIEKALENSGLDCKDIDYISVHGTGTKANDVAEASALSQIFGEKIQEIPVSSIKSMIGHTMGAAAAIEAVASILVLNKQQIPININLNKLDPAIHLNVIKEPAKAKVKSILSNSFAFGGNISCIILKKED